MVVPPVPDEKEVNENEDHVQEPMTSAFQENEIALDSSTMGDSREIAINPAVSDSRMLPITCPIPGFLEFVRRLPSYMTLP